MKLFVFVILCLAVGSQGRVLQPPKEAIDIPVTIVQDDEPAEKKKLAEIVPVPVTVPVPVPVPEQKPIEVPAKPVEKIEQPAGEIVKEEVQQQLKTEQIEEKIKEPEQPQAVLKPEEPNTVEQEKVKEGEAEQAETQPQTQTLKELAAENGAETVPLPVEVPVQNLDPEDAVQPAVRQATQATPTQQQSTTQQNFVQQLIQNSPIGQFLNQFNGQNQQQADAPATPAPTVPGFLNPAAAITSAQQAVQNAAQSVVNTTTQAFQGIQQFANNLGTQFQNTLSGLTGQQSPEPTTPRPPGPIQSFVNNVFGGGNNATAAAPPQQQGPLQGIINFLGGNRPQNANPATPIVTDKPAAEKPAVDDKVDEVQEQQPIESDDANEVRNSAEAIDDSFEEAVPVDEVIVVNDDSAVVDPVEASQSDPKPVQVELSLQQEPESAVVPADDVQ
ncbi:20-hydroxyecdysone protein [Scaptodrosophila lebanonensis]|uniref:20-hydroxyecdysone protein n=1 Tax=Drosophila lebanonensis TaxID=7225 RepID=A0A6J2UF52_DROLE|nr:20-hydroxyecdysone protein [Scaptodrosophila lebanonensis]